MKTSLPQYDLWYDGSVVVKAQDIEKFISKVPSSRLFVEKMTPEIKQFNELMSKADRIKTKDAEQALDFSWNLPEPYKTMDVKQFVLAKLEDESTGFSDNGMLVRYERVLLELKKYKDHDLLNLLRCLIFVVDTFTTNKLVWGVGRGSSVSSYVLYLIGIHDIDSVEFDLPFTDFIKT